MSKGSEAFTAKGREWAEQTRTRKARAAHQKAAKEARAYDEYPGTPEDLVKDHQALRIQFYAREAGRRTA